MGHYHVGSNVPGYLPEGDVYTVGTMRDAVEAMRDEIRRFRDDQEDAPGRRRLAAGRTLDGYVLFTRPGDSHDLGIAFWWERCSEVDCQEDGEA